MECVLDNIKVHYEIFGEGRPILMLHGWPVDHNFLIRVFEPIFKDLEGWKRIYLDLPGMGKTSGAEWIKTQDDMLEVVLEFIDHVIMDDRFYIVGESYGAYLARGILQKRSASIDGLMILIPMIYANREQWTLPEHQILYENPEFYEELKSNNLEEFLVYVTDQNDQCVENLRSVAIPSIQMADYEFLNGIGFDTRFSFEINNVVPPFSKPTLIVVGRQDSVVGYRDAWDVIENFPRATFAVLDYAGHAIGFGERDTIFMALVNDWIDRLERDTEN
jgi:pimeloyl-ACP methyl ester carboxylesterase